MVGKHSSEQAGIPSPRGVKRQRSGDQFRVKAGGWRRGGFCAGTSLKSVAGLRAV